MKVEVNQKAVEPKSEYPCLKVNESGLIVLFTSSKTGTVIQSDNYHPLGEYGIDWIENNYTTFTGAITLSND